MVWRILDSMSNMIYQTWKKSDTNELTWYGEWMEVWADIMMLFQERKYIVWIPMGVIFMGVKLGAILTRVHSHSLEQNHQNDLESSVQLTQSHPMWSKQRFSCQGLRVRLALWLPKYQCGTLLFKQHWPKILHWINNRKFCSGQLLTASTDPKGLPNKNTLCQGLHVWNYKYKSLCKIYECMLKCESSKLSMLVRISQDDC